MNRSIIATLHRSLLSMMLPVALGCYPPAPSTQPQTIWKEINDHPLEDGFARVIDLPSNYRLQIYETYDNNLELKLFQFESRLVMGITLGNASLTGEQIRLVNLDGKDGDELVIQPYDRSSTYGANHTLIFYQKGIYWYVINTNLDRARLVRDGRRYYFIQPENPVRTYFDEDHTCNNCGPSD